MEPVAGELQEPRVGSSNFLDLPYLCPWDSDDELLSLEGINPKSSPIPKRRSSVSSSSEDDSQPPASSSRRVSFADTFGLSLVSVKQFDSWSACDPSDPLEGELTDAKEYILNLHFALPLTSDELVYKVRGQKLELESLELLPGTTTLKGIVRVLNMCFDKLVYIRTSLDCWRSHFDLLAEYVPGSDVEDMDCFSFKLTLVPPFGEEGARVDFCLRYETPLGTFWANNSGQNYVLFCRERVKEQDENENKLKPKSCLKSTRSNSITEESPEIILNCETAAVTKPLGVEEEKIRAHPLKQQEENSRNRSRRSRRKAARMAKIQQYFTQREEKDNEQLEKDTETNINEQVLTTKEEPSNFSKTEIQDIILSSPVKSNKTVVQKCTASSEDTNSKQVPTVQTQLETIKNIPERQPEFNSQTKPSLSDSVNIHKNAVGRVSQALENSQDNEPVSLRQHLHKSQLSDKCVSKSVEKAWESFEKGAAEQMGNPSDMTGGKTDHGKDTQQQNRSCNFTFATIVAPLYHQVFERLENDRRDLISRPHKAAESVGKLKDESVRVVTYPSYSKTQSRESRPNPCISQKQDVYYGTCKETCPRYLLNKKDTTEKAELQDSLAENPQDQNNSEAKIQRHKALLPNHPLYQLEGFPNVLSWEEFTLDQAEEMAEMILQDEDSSISSSENMEYAENNNPLCEGSLETSHHTHIPEDFPILSTQSQLDSTTLKQSPSVFSDNPLSEATQTILGNDRTKIQDNESQTQTADGTPDTNMKGLEESHVPIPEPSFHSDISINVTPNISETLMLSQNLTQATSQTQSPDITCHKHNLETTGSIPVQFQVTEATHLTQDSNITPDSAGWHDVDNNLHNINGSEKILTDSATETSESPEGTALDRISPNLQHVSKTNNEPNNLDVNVPDGDTDLNGSSNTYESASPEKEIDIWKENEQTEYVDKNEEQVSTGMKQNQAGKREDMEEKLQEEEKLQKQQENGNIDSGNEHKSEHDLQYRTDDDEGKEGDQEILPQQNVEEHANQQNLNEWEGKQGLLPEQNIEKSENANDTMPQQDRKECKYTNALLVKQIKNEREHDQSLQYQQNTEECENANKLQPQQNMEESENAKDLLPQENRKECEHDQELLPQQNMKGMEEKVLLSQQNMKGREEKELLSQQNRKELANETGLLPQQSRNKFENKKDVLLQQNMGEWKDHQDLLPQQIKKERGDNQDLLPQHNMKECENDQKLFSKQNIKECENDQGLLPQQNTKESEDYQEHLPQQNTKESEDYQEHLPQKNIKESEDDQGLLPQKNIKESEDDQGLLPQQYVKECEDDQELLLQQNIKECEDDQELLSQQNIKESEDDQELLSQKNVKKCEDDQELLPQQNIKEKTNNQELLPQQNTKECENDQEILSQQNIKESEDDQELLSQQNIKECEDDQEILQQQNIKECEDDQELLQQQNVKESEDDQELLSQQNIKECEDDQELLQQQNIKECENDQELLQQQNIKECENDQELLSQQNIKECENDQELLSQQNIKESEDDQELLSQQNVKECEDDQELLQKQNIKECEDDQELLQQQNVKECEDDQELLSQQNIKECEDDQELLSQQNIKECENDKELLSQQNIKECENDQELLSQQNVKKCEDDQELLPQQNIKECEDDQELLLQQNIKECEDDQELLSQQNIKESEDDQELLSQQNVKKCEDDQELLPQQYIKECEDDQELLLQQNIKECEDDQELLSQQNIKESEDDQELLSQQNIKESEDDQELLPPQYIKECEDDQELLLQQNIKECEDHQELLPQQNIKGLEEKELLAQQNNKELETENNLPPHNMKEIENAKDILPQQNMDEQVDDQHIFPKPNMKEWKDEQYLQALEIQTQALEMANIESFTAKAYPDITHEPQTINKPLEQKSDEPMDKSNAITEEKEISWKTDSSQHTLTQNNSESFCDRGDGLENNSKQIDICYKIPEVVNANDEVQKCLESNSINEQTEKNMDDGASTESLSDEEMQLCLHRLRSSEQSGFREGMSMGKRPSISRTMSIPSPMPSISESINEDQPGALLDDLTNEEMMELERAALPLVDDEVTGSNVLWWREFFSSANRSAIIVYTVLLVVFLVTAYFCDFVACFGLYLLAIYCLYFQRQKEPLKSS